MAGAWLRRGHGPERQRLARRLALVEQLALALLVVSGLLAMRANGWSFGWPRWLGVKAGLSVFLLLPLGVLQAIAVHGFEAPGLRRPGAAGARLVERGLALEGMVRTLQLVLGLPALLLCAWLALARPF